MAPLATEGEYSFTHIRVRAQKKSNPLVESKSQTTVLLDRINPGCQLLTGCCWNPLTWCSSPFLNCFDTNLTSPVCATCAFTCDNPWPTARKTFPVTKNHPLQSSLNVPSSLKHSLGRQYHLPWPDHIPLAFLLTSNHRKSKQLGKEFILSEIWIWAERLLRDCLLSELISNFKC